MRVAPPANNGHSSASRVRVSSFFFLLSLPFFALLQGPLMDFSFLLVRLQLNAGMEGHE